MTDDSNEPDAFVIVHRPTDDSEPYGIGPFPPVPGLDDALLAHPTCGCSLSVMWIRFPTGVVMALGAHTDTSEAIRALAETLAEALAEDRARNDRLN